MPGGISIVQFDTQRPLNRGRCVSILKNVSYVPKWSFLRTRFLGRREEGTMNTFTLTIVEVASNGCAIDDHLALLVVPIE